MQQPLKDLIVKCLMSTTSGFDGEALNAIRSANALLAKVKINWEEFCADPVPALRPAQPPPQPQPQPQPAQNTTARDWDYEISRIIARVPAKYHNFLNSVRSQYNATGRISPKQEAGVRKFM